MLESLVASILNRILGSYVENFDPKQLRIGLLSGDVKLAGLKLKSGALDQLQLPLNIVNGHIGSLILQIPYSNLKSKPVKVFIEDVFLIAKPDMEHEEGGQKRREQAAKMEKLQVWEISSERAMNRTQGQSGDGNGADSDAERQKQQNFTSSLVSKIVENVQVTIKNIHVRFEDLSTGVALGATLGELSAVSTNKNWEPAFIANIGETTHKLATLDSLAFYVDPEVSTEFTSADSYDDKQQLLDDFKALIFDSVGATDILRPINGQGFITMNKSPADETVPRIKADLRFEELSVNLGRQQYVDALRLTENFQRYFRSLRYRKHRPKVPVAEDPMAWFRYAANTVLDGVRERRRQWTWEAMKEHLEDQKEYIDLYKKWYRGGSTDQAFTAKELAAFNAIQQRQSYEKLTFFRSLAKKQMVSERKEMPEKPQATQTWTEWLWGSKPANQSGVSTTNEANKQIEASNPSSQGAENAAPIEITDEQRQELLDVLDVPSLNEDTASQILMSVEFSLRSAGVRLKSGDISLASAGFEGVHTRFVNRPNSFAVEMSVDKFEVSDLTHKNQFSEVIRVQNIHGQEQSKEPFFWFLFEHHPMDRVADSNLFLKSQSVVIVHNARLLESIMMFFAPPPEQGETVEAILQAANKTVEELRQQTRIGLEYALENHKTLNLKLDIKAPTIVIPLDTNNADSAAAVLDVGSLQMASDLVPQNVLNEVKSKQALQYSESDWKRLESLMYDKFTIKLCDTQVLLGERMSDITKSLGKDSSDLHFLDKATLQFLLELSIVPRNPTLTRCRISVKLPTLRATLADVQYLLFMKIIAAATPHPSDPESAGTMAASSNPREDKKSDEEKNAQIKSTDELVEDLQTSETETHSEDSQGGDGASPPQKHPQRMFEMVFTVSEVHLYVVRGWRGRPLVDMCLHDFSIKTWSNDGVPQEALGVDMTIRDLLITDHSDTSSPPELRKIAESAGHTEKLDSVDHTGNSSSSSQADPYLFRVQFRKTESGDQEIDVTLAKIRFNLDPTTVLTIYDYIMSTFTSPQPDQSDAQRANVLSPSERPAIESASSQDSDTKQATDNSQNRIKVTVNMRGITAILVDSQQPAATLSMEKSQLNIELLDAIKVQFALGTVSLVDSSKHDLLSIEGGNDLVDFRYETFPPPKDSSSPEPPALVYLRMGHVKIQIIQEPLTKLVSFLTRFTVMKAAYDQARMMAFNQAIQVEPGKFLFDVVVSTPIILWPRDDASWMRLDLGEVYIQNEFKGTANHLTSGIRNVQVTSSIQGSEQQIVPKTDLKVTLAYSPDSEDISLPVTIVHADLSPIHVIASEHQYQLIMRFFDALTKISAGTASAGIKMDEVGNLRRQLAEEKQIEEKQTSYWWGENFSVSLGADENDSPSFRKRPKLKFDFEAPLFDITLNFEDQPLSRFSIGETAADVTITNCSDMEVNFYLTSFFVEDLGNAGSNKFPQIIPPVKNNSQQLLGRMVQRKGQAMNLECSLDSPQVILALEYMLSLKKYLEFGQINDSGKETSDQSDIEDDEDFDEDSDFGDDYEYDERSSRNFYANSVTSSSAQQIDSQDLDSSRRLAARRINDRSQSPSSGSSRVGAAEGEEGEEGEEGPANPLTPIICVNIVDMYLTVLADESDENTEAIVFKIEQLVVNTGETSSITLSKVGMFLTRMQSFKDSKLRVLDDFNITASIDNSESTESLRLANVQASINPLVLRISLREIEMILGIVSKAGEIATTGNKDPQNKAAAPTLANKKATNFFADDHRVAVKKKRSISGSNTANTDQNARGSEGPQDGRHHSTRNSMRITRVLAEQLTAQFEGLRLVLIDPIHQLPMTDFCVKPFTVTARNWSDSLTVNAKAEMYANVHSFTKSAWEPLVDTMEFGLTITGDAIELFSNTVADVELTPETIELAHDIKAYFDDPASREYKRLHHEEGAPYRIRNETGIAVTVWADSPGSTNTSRRKIANAQEIKWAFHDWRQLRENLNATEQDSSLGVEFEDKEYDLMRSVPINRIGEHLLVVKRGEEKVRLIFDVWVENHLKYICIRSTELVKNHTETELEMMCMNGDRRKIISLPPHSEISFPLSDVDSRLLIRRKGDEQWSNRSLYWKDLVKKGKTTLQCTDNFFLSVNPEIPDVPLTETYPYMSINLSAPFQFVNNLSQDITLRLYSRDMRRETQKQVEKAGRILIHDYNEEVLLLLRIDMEGYSCNKYAVVNAGHGRGYEREFHPEESVEVSQDHQKLQLKLDYVNLDNGEGRLIVIYTPYVILNSTSRELLLSGKQSRIICPPSSASPWSFNHINAQNSIQKVTIATKYSQHSAPVSLDASGSTSEVRIVSKDRQRELYLGVMVTQGSGRYVNTKIVNLSPQFILVNSLDRPLAFREPGSGRSRSGSNRDGGSNGEDIMTADPGKAVPVGFMWAMANKEMCVKFADTENSDWSSSFPMVNVGVNHVRVSERGKPTVLVKIEVILEGATLFVHLSRAKMWPYSIRNFSEREFVFYQCDPLTDEDGGEITNRSERFVPITYRLPPKSTMPYSWDFPAAKIKQLVLELSSKPPPKPARPPALPSRPSTASFSSEVVQSSNNSVAESQTPSASRKNNGHRVKRRHVQLAEIGELPPANFGSGVIVDIAVIADGPQQAMVIAPHNPEASNYDARTNTVKAEAWAEIEAIEASSGRAVRLNMKGIGISVISHNSQELLYATLRNVKVGYNLSEALETFSLQVQWIQIDNTLPGSNDFPVIVYPTVLPKTAAELAAHPCFSASLTRVRDDSYGLTYIKHATLLLQEMTIEADEDFLLAFVDNVISLATRKAPQTKHHKVYQPLLDDNSALCDDVIHIPALSGESKGEDIYFEQLHLQPIQLNLSFLRTGSLSTSAIFKDNNVAGNLAFIIDALTMTIGNINDAPVRFNALLVDNVRTDVTTLANMTQVHYQQEFIYQLHKIVGSADIIGNPVGLFNNISSGVMDLFYEPYMGYTLNDRPQEFGVGLAKGGLSFMKKSVFGLSDSVSKFTGALSKGISAITLDSRYQTQQRARRTRNRPKHAVYGFKYGVESLYESLSSGFMGLAEAPMQGAVTDGGAGFFKGLGVGLLGLPTKTTVGLLDFASNLTEGIRNTTTVFDEHDISRVRLPRVVSSDGVLRPYNVRESVGQMVLHSVKDNKYAKDRYLAHSNVTRNRVIVVSLERIMVAAINDMSLEWSITFDQVESFSMESTGISITLLGGAHGPFIPLSEESSRKYIYKAIGKGVDEYNRLKITLY